MITPEEAQKVYDLRAKMTENVKNGRHSHYGITDEMIRESLAFVRRNRSAAGAAGGKAKAAKAKKPTIQVDTKAFTDIDLD